MKTKNICIIQARMGSKRLPGKVLLKVKGKTLLEHQLNRLKHSKLIEKVVIATTELDESEPIVQFCHQMKIPFFRGSENDVLDRYYQCAQAFPGFDNIVRVTSDCPLIDPEIVDQTIALFLSSKVKYGSNCYPPTFPDGLDTEVFTVKALRETWKNAALYSEREHVTFYMERNLSKSNLESEVDYSDYRMTIDYLADFELIKRLITEVGPLASFSEYVSHIDNHNLRSINNVYQRNEGHKMAFEMDKKMARMGPKK